VSYYRGLSVIAAGLDGVALSLIGAPGRCYDSREGGETLASQPKRAAFAAEIEAAGGDGVILDRLRSGETVKAIADTYGVSRGMIYLWKKMGGESRADAWEEARKDSAEALLEDAGEILDALAVPGENGEAPDPSNAQVSVARERAGHRRYLAEKFNREAFGDRGGAGGVVVLGDLHLEALRSRGTPEALPAPADGDVVEADYTIEEETDPIIAELRDS
jgi:transposase-like protein